MLPPNPQDVPISEGRFNHFGQGHWYCIPRSKKDIGALKKGHSALKRGQLKNCQI